MIVYGSSLSPFVRKVLAFAAEKGIEVENKPLALGATDPDFLSASPFRKIPAFRHPGAGENGDDFTISDSTAIVAYLDALRPEPNLIPTEAKARARAVWYDEFMDTVLFDCGRKMFFNRVVGPKFLGLPCNEAEADKAEREELPPLLAYLEGVISDSGFLVEDRLTLADIAVASPFVNFHHLNIVVDPATYPKLSRYVAAILARPSFAPLMARESAFLERFAA